MARAERQRAAVSRPPVGLATVALLAASCAAGARVHSYRAAVFESARAQCRAERPPPGPAALVERALHDAGLRFGTDGSAGALYSYMRLRHSLVSASRALPGDVLFFDTSDGGRAGCATHAGIVEAVLPDGRIAFIESRAGRVRRSFVHPGRTLARRDERGVVLNSFLRVKRVEDGPAARYLAGEMLCAVGRVR